MALLSVYTLLRQHKELFEREFDMEEQFLECQRFCHFALLTLIVVMLNKE